MNREIVWTTRFKKDYKLAIKRHLDIDLLDDIIRALSRGEKLPEKNKDHELSGDWVGHRECHIQPDWLLVYRIDDDILVLTLARTGTHSEAIFSANEIPPYGKQTSCTVVFFCSKFRLLFSCLFSPGKLLRRFPQTLHSLDFLPHGFHLLIL